MIIKSLALALAPAAIGAASAAETFYFTFNKSAFNDVGVTETGWVTIEDTGLGVGYSPGHDRQRERHGVRHCLRS